MPFLAEEMYQNLIRSRHDSEPVSVHLTHWPQADDAWQNDALIEAVAVVQKIVALGRSAREASRIRVRQPLAELLVRVPDQPTVRAVTEHEDQVLEELNVKRLSLIATDAQLVSYRIKPNLPRVGKHHGKLIPAIREALAEANGGTIASAHARGESITLIVCGQQITFEPEDLLIETESAEGYSCAESEGYLVALDTALTPELKREGIAREIVRTVQDARKQAGLEVSDRIHLHVVGTGVAAEAITVHREWIMAETLTAHWPTTPIDDGFATAHTLDESGWQITLARVPVH
jgi:isoleucyl-tRNA synthetase